MEPTYVYYRSAAQAVRRGWAQNAWHDEDRNPCMLQAVIDAMGGSEEAVQLPMKVQLELDSQLQLVASYCPDRNLRRKRRKALKNGLSLQQFIWGWNDTAGRTKDEVAGILDDLADRQEVVYRLHIQQMAAKAVRYASWREVDDHLTSVWEELTVGTDLLVPT